MYWLVFTRPFTRTVQTEGGVLSDMTIADSKGYAQMMFSLHEYDVISLHMVAIDHSGHTSWTDVNDDLYDEAVQRVERQLDELV